MCSAPGWSSYEWRLRYRSYDVTNLPRPRPPASAAELSERSSGRNQEAPGPETDIVLGMALGNGWLRGRLGWQEHRAIYGPELGAFAQLEIRFADGHEQIVVTDETWRAGQSNVVANDLYEGETID